MSAATLRLLACIAMLLDHIGFALSLMPLRIVGRLAYPIFLYLICNGYRHTTSPFLYALRLGLFALISQIPFSLLSERRISFENGNIFVTLLLGLVCIWMLDRMLHRKVLRWFSLFPALAVFLLYHFEVIRSDYGARAILSVTLFFLLEYFGVSRFRSVAMGLLTGLCYGLINDLLHGEVIGQWDWVQFFSLAALPLIHSYNGQSGLEKFSDTVQTAIKWGFYLFYPLHLLLLWFLFVR